MATTPIGFLAMVRHLVREALAASDAFRQWCGVDTAQAARERVLWEHQETAPIGRPFVIIANDGESGAHILVAESTYRARGRLRVVAVGHAADAVAMENQWSEFLVILRSMHGAEVDGRRLAFGGIELPGGDGNNPGFRPLESQATATAGEWVGEAYLTWGGEV